MDFDELPTVTFRGGRVGVVKLRKATVSSLDLHLGSHVVESQNLIECRRPRFLPWHPDRRRRVEASSSSSSHLHLEGLGTWSSTTHSARVRGLEGVKTMRCRYGRHGMWSKWVRSFRADREIREACRSRSNRLHSQGALVARCRGAQTWGDAELVN